MTKTNENHRGRLPALLRTVGWSGVAAALLAPAVAMRFTGQVAWTASDFVFAAVVLGAAGALAELAVWRSGSWAYRLGAGVAIAASVMLLWAGGAVGIVGSEDDPANLLFVGVIAVAVVGAVLTRFRASGLARAMAVAGAAQAAVGVAALILRWGSAEPAWPADVALATIVFCAAWFGSAALFGAAGRKTS